MARGPVNFKQLSIESYYGYMNIHLELLHKSLLDKNKNEVMLQIKELKEIRNVLLRLGYFERAE